MNTRNIKDLSDKINEYVDKKLNEQQTKQSIILPLFMALGYDIFNINEFIPEYVADFGTKQGEKVDYAIMVNGKPIIIVEVKRLGTNLTVDCASQLFRYYSATDAKIAILTNGIDYYFYTDNIKSNQMDLNPYMKLSLRSITNEEIGLLGVYSKESVDKIIDYRYDIRLWLYSRMVRWLKRQLTSGNIPDSLIRYICELSSIKDNRLEDMRKIFKENWNTEFDYGISNTSEIVRDKRDTNDISKNDVYTNDSDEEYAGGLMVQYNKYNFKGHKPDKLYICGKEIWIDSFKDMYLNVLGECASKSSKIDTFVYTMKLAKCEISKDVIGKMRIPGKLCGVDYYTETSLSTDSMVKRLERALRSVGIKDEDVVVRLKW